MNHAQVINLYLPEFRQHREWLSAARALQIVAVVVLLMAGVNIYQYFNNDTLAAELAGSEQQRQQAVLATERLNETLGLRVEDQGLVTRIERLEGELESKQALLQFMSGRQLGNTQGFSEYLADLSRYYTSGLSLNLISIHNGGEAVHLEGKVIRAELVPLYLQSLSQGASYQGKSFQTVEISEAPLSILNSLTALASGDKAQPETWNFSVSSDGAP